MMRINLTSVMIEAADQEKALKFYTEVLGFKKKTEVPLGKFKWLTVVSPGSEEVELLLEPMEFAPAKVFQKALYDAGIPAKSFAVDDIYKETERLKKLGVKFKMEPASMGTVIVAVFDDTFGNYLQIVSPITGDS
jgi:predicted enzyme related to lactoylglutathione lyase